MRFLGRAPSGLSAIIAGRRRPGESSERQEGWPCRRADRDRCPTRRCHRSRVTPSYAIEQPALGAVDGGGPAVRAAVVAAAHRDEDTWCGPDRSRACSRLAVAASTPTAPKPRGCSVGDGCSEDFVPRPSPRALPRPSAAASSQVISTQTPRPDRDRRARTSPRPSPRSTQPGAGSARTTAGAPRRAGPRAGRHEDEPRRRAQRGAVLSRRDRRFPRSRARAHAMTSTPSTGGPSWGSSSMTRWKGAHRHLDLGAVGLLRRHPLQRQPGAMITRRGSGSSRAPRPF